VFTTSDGQKFKTYKEALAYAQSTGTAPWTPEKLLQLKNMQNNIATGDAAAMLSDPNFGRKR
jgi:hypothetical protein